MRRRDDEHRSAGTWLIAGMLGLTAVAVALGVALGEERPSPRPGPSPLLVDRAELERARRSQLERLHSWGWVDTERGIVRIPVERAAELLAREGFRLGGER